MQMFLIILLTAVPVLALISLIVVGLDRKRADDEPPVVLVDRRAEVSAPRFFASTAVASTPSPRLQTDDLVSQLERYVRLEQQAAETYLELPTPASLHSRTPSQFLN